MTDRPSPEQLRARVTDPSLSPIERLTLLMSILRSPEGCAWDRKQSHQSLTPYLIEESYEVVDAISSGESAKLKEELGDLLVQIVFHAQLASERHEFTLHDVAAQVVDKLVFRHPHVFESVNELAPDQVREQWEQIKSRERAGTKKSLLDGLPKSMPALTRAFRLGEKAGGVGFDWPDAQGAREKIDEELLEIDQAVASNLSVEKLESEIGDLLFAVASFARKSGIDPEKALGRSLDSFTSRFGKMESMAAESGKELASYTLAELENLWQSAKKRG